MKTRVMIVDDHGIIREGLRLLINCQRDMEVVAEAEDGHEALKHARNLSPEIIVMDVEMPNLNGIDTTAKLSSSKWPASIIALSAHRNQRYIKEMLKAGAKGYLLKYSAGDELLNAIRAVKKGKTYLSPEIADTLADHFRWQPDDNASAFTTLTSREREVLQMLAEGKTRKEAAFELCLSPKTIATHLENIMGKLRTHSVAELTRYAIREGITSI